MNSTSECKISEERLLLVVTGDATAEEIRAVNTHGTQCSHCAARLRALRQTLEHFSERSVPALPAGLELQVRTAVAAEEARPPLRLVPWLVRLAACFLLAAWLALWLRSVPLETPPFRSPRKAPPLRFKALDRFRPTRQKVRMRFAQRRRKRTRSTRLFASIDRKPSKKRLFKSFT